VRQSIPSAKNLSKQQGFAVNLCYHFNPTNEDHTSQTLITDYSPCPNDNRTFKASPYSFCKASQNFLKSGATTKHLISLLRNNLQNVRQVKRCIKLAASFSDKLLLSSSHRVEINTDPLVALTSSNSNKICLTNTSTV
jgi:hypothetical protein